MNARLCTILLLLASIQEGFSQDLALLGSRIEQRLGALPNPGSGYRLSGTFIYKRGPQEVRYRAILTHAGAVHSAEFQAEDPAWNMTFGDAAGAAWAESPEAVVSLASDRIPAVARYDFVSIAAGLRAIVGRGASDPAFQSTADGPALYVRGTLPDRNVATFMVESQRLTLRKVTIHSPSAPLASWCFLVLDRGGPLIMEPGVTFGPQTDLWFSDHDAEGDFPVPRRIDFVDPTGVAGSFFLDRSTAASVADVRRQPLASPAWTRDTYSPSPNRRQPSLLIAPGGLISRDETAPGSSASAARRLSMSAALWAVAAPRVAVLFPGTPNPRFLAIGMGIAVGGLALLLIVQKRRFGTRILKASVVLAILLAAIGLSGLASIHMGSARTHSLLALHAAVRHSESGLRMFSPVSAGYFNSEADRPLSPLERARAVIAWTAAYDLSCGTLDRAAQAGAEKTLFARAKPLAGSLMGWRRHSAESGTLSSALGFAGLALGREDWVKTASESLRQVFAEQFAGGVHRNGPGPGVEVLGDILPFLHGLVQTGRADAELERLWASAVEATVQLISPVGTLPLFGQTSLDQSADAAFLMEKAGRRLQPGTAARALAAARAFWDRGRYWATGAGGRYRAFRLFLDRVAADPLLAFFAVRNATPSTLPGSSFLSTGNTLLVLRGGADADSLYLAANALPPALDQPVRDAMSIDLYGAGSLLLAGEGYSNANARDRGTASGTAARNVPVIQGRNQTGAGGPRIAVALLNQPLFDLARLDSESVYDSATVIRDVVLARPQAGRRGYFVLVDDVRAVAEDSAVAWNLHGRGKLSLGVARTHLWTMSAFGPRLFGGTDLRLTVGLFGEPGTPNSLPGRLFFRNPAFNENMGTLAVLWRGSRKLGTVLIQIGEDDPPPVIEWSDDQRSVRVNKSDTISAGRPGVELSLGSARSGGDLVAMRDRGTGFPGVAIMNGTYAGLGSHEMKASAPVFASLEGFSGTIRTTQPGVVVGFRSPAIKSGQTFSIDGQPVIAAEGRVTFTLDAVGAHKLGR